MEIEICTVKKPNIFPGIFLAATLTGCASLSTSMEGTVKSELQNANTQASNDDWEVCRNQVYADIEPTLSARGYCGASNCFDEHGNSMQQLVVQHCGYPEHTTEETAGLMEVIQQAIDTEKGLSSREIRTLYYYPIQHSVSIAAAKAEQIAAARRAREAKAEYAQVAQIKPIHIESSVKPFRCEDLTKAEAYRLLAQGHNYLDRDSDGNPCEWDTGSYPHRSISTTSGNCHYVSAYRRKDGAYVRGHTRCR